MRKVFKWMAVSLGTLMVLLLLACCYIYFRVESRFNKQYEVSLQPIAIPTDPAALELGRHIVNIKGCGDCHGKDLGGKVVFNDADLGYLAGPNITTGKGGLLSRNKTYSDEDYIRALRNGLGKDHKTLVLMPSYEYNPLSQKDLGALIAYLKRVPPVDRQMPEISLKPMAYVLAHFEKLPLVVADKIDHAAKSQQVVHPQVTAAYGKYLAVSCVGCHRQDFRGGEGLLPGSPPVPDISSSGNVGKWSEAAFTKTLRTGVTPDGRQLNSKFMPWHMTKAFTDTEIKSVYLFLTSLGVKA